MIDASSPWLILFADNPWLDIHPIFGVPAGTILLVLLLLRIFQQQNGDKAKHRSVATDSIPRRGPWTRLCVKCGHQHGEGTCPSCGWNGTGFHGKRLATCPLCGGTLKGQFKKCMHCASELAWVEGLPCDPAHEQELLEKRRLERLQTQAIAEAEERARRASIAAEEAAEAKRVAAKADEEAKRDAEQRAAEAERAALWAHEQAKRDAARKQAEADRLRKRSELEIRTAKVRAERANAAALAQAQRAALRAALRLKLHSFATAASTAVMARFLIAKAAILHWVTDLLARTLATLAGVLFAFDSFLSRSLQGSEWLSFLTIVAAYNAFVAIFSLILAISFPAAVMAVVVTALCVELALWQRRRLIPQCKQLSTWLCARSKAYKEQRANVRRHTRRFPDEPSIATNKQSDQSFRSR